MSGSATLAEQWGEAVAARSQETFLIFEGPPGAGAYIDDVASIGHVAEWTYGDFDRVVARMAMALVDRGVHQGAAVHLALTNSPTFVAVWLAATRLGAWIVPSDPMGKRPELADHVERTRPAVGFCAASRTTDYPGAAIEIDEADVSFAWLPTTEFADWPTVDPTDRAAVMFTSGTTGRPKGVEVTQANYAFAGHTMAAAASLQPDDRQLVVLPLFHANAQYYSIASAVSVGASVALMHTFSASGFLPAAARHRATCASLFAAPIRMILARGGPAPDLRLRHCWYAQNISAEQYATIAEWLGCRPRQLYGMTETISAVLTEAADDPEPDAMGYVTPRCAVDIQDTDGRSVDPGEEGEIVVGGEPGLTLFAGYLDDPATTAASFRDGWFLTGDRATRDATGRHHFAGRRSDVLKVAGENVSTVEVEQCLTAHPKVLEAAVVGAPDAIRDEVPVAFVVAADPGAPPTADELLAWAADHLGKAKVPRDITFLAELPRTSVGKIRKFVLKEGA